MDRPRISSALKAVDLRQEPRPLIIGERLNTQGSRKAKRMVLDGDYDGLVGIARTQAEDGAHCLDVCVATTELTNELEFMTRLVKKISLEVDAPLVIDSTDPEVIESAVRQIPGRPVINSINLEGDGSKFRALAPIMARYGIPAISMCIGPDGMAKTPQQKLATARLLYEEGKKYGLNIEQFIFDVLTFTLGTGTADQINAGNDTLEGIRLVKEHLPGCLTTLGLSNISFGLSPPARKVINSVFLHHALKAGLDSAIVNAKEIVPYGEIDPAEARLAEDLVFNSHPDALADLIAHFDKTGAGPGEAKKAAIDPDLPPGKRAYLRIIHRLKDGIEDDVVEAIAEKLGDRSIIQKGQRLSLDAPLDVTHEGAIRTLNEDLLPAMKEVGDKFGSGELILPFVLKSAECMKAAVGELEKYLVKKEGTSKGKLVLGTVYGDVHDIGKNLVKTIFQNNGYEVYDLGKQVPMQKFLEKIKEVDADAVGLSALLVATSKQMELFVDHARENSLGIPILCGGAAINTNYINRIAKKGGIYESGAFYCNTMFEGLKTMDALVSDRDALLAKWRKNLEEWKDRTPAQVDRSRLPKSKITPASDRPVPGSMGVVRLGSGNIDMREVWEMVDKKSLLKMSWGVRGKAAAQTQDAHEDLLNQWKARITREKLFEPQAVYGYFECRGRDGSLTVSGPKGDVTFDFPRSARSEHLCLADYFGPDDVVAFQAVTMGCRAAEEIGRLDAEDKYTDSYYLHGLAVEATEALAEWTNRRIKSELGLEKGGLRYSWGYASCPDILQHRLVWNLLHPEKSGMSLTDAGQIVPEQSTAAIIVHHPDAKYFEL
ncbi:MAG: methionine synthase [Nitrosopumilus sp. H8]|nr:MAG: methionine synthase [Nitrosopumilus sp. H8]